MILCAGEGHLNLYVEAFCRSIYNINSTDLPLFELTGYLNTLNSLSRRGVAIGFTFLAVLPNYRTNDILSRLYPPVFDSSLSTDAEPAVRVTFIGKPW